LKNRRLMSQIRVSAASKKFSKQVVAGLRTTATTCPHCHRLFALGWLLTNRSVLAGILRRTFDEFSNGNGNGHRKLKRNL
jgi:hypothetical protein